MPAVIVIDRSGKEPSPLVRRLMADGYHVLCLADCRTALDTLRCIRAQLVIIDVASRPRAAAEGLIKLLARDGSPHPAVSPKAPPPPPRVPVMVLGATLEDQCVLSELLSDGEVVPAACSSPTELARRVARYIAPSRPPGELAAKPPAESSLSATLVRNTVIVPTGLQTG